MLGFIARCDNTGLGIESVDFVRHMHPDKILVAMAKMYGDHPERFASEPDVVYLEKPPDEVELDRFLTGLDTVFCIELPYDWGLLDAARARGIRTILRINYEYLADPLPHQPDLLIAPIDWYQPEGTMILPFPVDRERFRFKRRMRADTFLHVTGRIGRFGRNGTPELLQAIPLVRSDVRFLIYAQTELPAIDDPRVEIRIGDFPDNAVLFEEGDIFVLPRRYGGQSLPMNEALSAGLPVLMSDMRPQNAFVPRELLVSCQSFDELHLDRTVEYAAIDPAAIAAAIDRLAHQDIAPLSDWANRYAQSISWDTLLPQYTSVLRNGHARTSAHA
jgi:glycosyltransferase involved in cell wall biosynthesis